MVQIALKQMESDDAVTAASSGNNLMWARYHSTFSCFIPPCCFCCFFANFTIPHSSLRFFTYLFWSQSEYSSPFGSTDCTAPLTICRSPVFWRKCQNVLQSVAQRPKHFNHNTLSSHWVLECDYYLVYRSAFFDVLDRQINRIYCNNKLSFG